jgi:hypothetical protein
MTCVSLRHHFAALMVAIAASCTCAVSATEVPPTVVWDGDRLAELRANPEKLTPLEQAAMKELLRGANAALLQKPVSVMEKELVPPSGDKHDYVSYGIYWWPDPNQPDGLPYIRRDGETNYKLVENGDSDRMEAMVNSVVYLSLANYITGERKYGEAAARHLDAWFLDPATRMNPHLEYGQAIPGRVDGRCVGIIDTTALVELFDAIAVLQTMGSLDESQIKGLNDWIAAYLDWLLESEMGLQEQKAPNNHGTWYAAQVARMALEVERPEVAKQVLEELRDKQMQHIFTEDGSQPREMARTRSFDYARFNLMALVVSAKCGDLVGLDLWNEPQKGANIKDGLDFLGPYLQFKKPWTHQQIVPLRFTPSSCRLLLVGYAKSNDPGYTEFLGDEVIAKPGEWMLPILTQQFPAATVSK